MFFCSCHYAGILFCQKLPLFIYDGDAYLVRCNIWSVSW